jgi:CRISPR system Cascade subunit CasD
LGRKSYTPSESIWIEGGLQDVPLRELLSRWPWIANRRKWEDLPENILISYESTDGSGVLKMDQPLSSFAERRFGVRFVSSELIPFPQEVADVPE